MKNLISLILPVLCFCQISAGQQEVTKSYNIEFKIISPSLSNDSSVYICGNLPQLGNWNPSAVKMKNMGDHTWSVKITTGSFYSVEYKYTLGSWQKEAAEASGRPLSNFIIKINGDTVINNSVLFWLNGENRKLSGKITGTVKYHLKMAGTGIPERNVIVWLPPDYEISKSKRYPVLYMQDGQNIFDPATSSFGVDWQLDETADSLIRNKIIDPIIVVGIYNTKGRMSEYTPGTAGTAYMEFVVNVVKPFIDKNYQTLSDRKNTYVGGSSAGGTISFMLGWYYPSVFSKAICMSPAFKIQNIDVVKDVSDYSGRKKRLTFYFDNGGKGLEERLQPGVDEMMKALEAKGFVLNKNLFWVSAPEGEHNEAAWAKRMPGALKLILASKK
jgi:predicted alpha/beta superfamily hydrolase